MVAILAIWGTLSGAVGFMLLLTARSAVHEIESGIAFLVATVAFGLAGVIHAIKQPAAEKAAAPVAQEYYGV